MVKEYESLPPQTNLLTQKTFSIMPFSRPWIYFINPFLIATRASYRLAVRMSTRHLDALKSKAGDPFFDDLIKFYKPLHDTLVAAYQKWEAQGGIQEGKTLSLEQLLDLQSNSKIQL